MSYYRVGNHGVIFSPTGPEYVAFGSPPEPTLVPRPFGDKMIVTGHSIPDAVIKYPWAGILAGKGVTPDIRASTGPYASASIRWNDRITAPDEVRALMEAGGASYDVFIGTEAHGGDYGGRASVGAHIEFSGAYAFALLWHNLAASTGADTFYANFWRDDTAQIFGSSWRAAQDLEGPLWDGIIDYVNANRTPGTPAMRLIPWLQVYAAVYDAIALGTVEDVVMSDFFSDNTHVSVGLGQWLQMATMMAVVYHRHPDEMPASWLLEYDVPQSISTAVAAQLRPVVWAACQSNPRTGLIA